jgi:hypothetical protein
LNSLGKLGKGEMRVGHGCLSKWTLHGLLRAEVLSTWAKIWFEMRYQAGASVNVFDLAGQFAHGSTCRLGGGYENTAQRGSEVASAI